MELRRRQIDNHGDVLILKQMVRARPRFYPKLFGARLSFPGIHVRTRHDFQRPVQLLYVLYVGAADHTAA